MKETLVDIMEMEMRRELEGIILNFLNLNKGNAFTPESILKRIKNDIQNLEMLEFFQKHTKGVLNKLAFSYQIDMHEHKGVICII